MSKKLPELQRTERPGTTAGTAAGTSAKPAAKTVSKPATKKPAAKKTTASSSAKRTAAAASAKPAARSTAAGRTAASKRAATASATKPKTTAKQPAKTAEKSSPETAKTGEVMTVDTEIAAPDTAAANAYAIRHEAKEIVSRYAVWSSAFSVLPVPIADVAGITGTQISMIVALSKLYGVPFSKTWIRSILGSIVGGVAPWAVTAGVVSTVFKSMPGIGLGVGFLGMAGLSNLATRTIGNLFIDHFEAGGDLSNVDTDAMRESLAEEMQKKK